MSMNLTLPNMVSLRGANLAGLDLFRPSFVQASLQSANLEGVTFFKADVDEPDASEHGFTATHYADFRTAVLDGANLSGARLDYDRCAGVDLRFAKLKSADLTNSNLRGLRLEGADLRFANLR